MEYSLFLTEQAKSDLAEIYSYISVELKSKKSAENVIDALHQAMKDLSLMPSRYHQFPNGTLAFRRGAVFYSSQLFNLLYGR